MEDMLTQVPLKALIMAAIHLAVLLPGLFHRRSRKNTGVNIKLMMAEFYFVVAVSRS